MLVARPGIATQSLNQAESPVGRDLKHASARGRPPACKSRQGQPALPFVLRLAAARFRSRRGRKQLLEVPFANKRIIAANVQGITGSKVDYTSIPFNKIQTFSIETSGTLDLDCEIQVYISAVGLVTFEVKGSFDIVGFNRMISTYVLS